MYKTGEVNFIIVNKFGVAFMVLNMVPHHLIYLG